MKELLRFNVVLDLVILTVAGIYLAMEGLGGNTALTVLMVLAAAGSMVNLAITVKQSRGRARPRG